MTDSRMLKAVHRRPSIASTISSAPADESELDRATAERVRAVASFGFTHRQARFLVTVMLHSGVFVGRQYSAFAGITHGQKVHDFVEKLLAQRGSFTPLPSRRPQTPVSRRKWRPIWAGLGAPSELSSTASFRPSRAGLCALDAAPYKAPRPPWPRVDYDDRALRQPEAGESADRRDEA